METKLTDKIKHIVVLMFENRSFDHIFGAFPKWTNPQNQPLYNLVDPSNETSEKIIPQEQSPYPNKSGDFCPDHSSEGMMIDLFGPGANGYNDGKPVNSSLTYPTTNSGFYYHNRADSVMNFLPKQAVKILTELADEFCLCDNWYCDVPGQTWPNRFFMHAATSLGEADNFFDQKNVKCIYDLISEHKKDWGIYAVNNALSDGNFIKHIAPKVNANFNMKEFYDDCSLSKLPFYSFITPDHNTCMHPSVCVELGQNLLADVYEALRNSPTWEETLFIVTFDENGGFFDHCFPPSTVSPDGLKYVSPFQPGFIFDFSLLGPRIPALLISPWLAKKSVDNTVYQNTSILKFTEDLLVEPNSLQQPPRLTKRDADATSIEHAFAQFGTMKPRKDCPLKIEKFADNICSFPPHEPPHDEEIKYFEMYIAGLPGHNDSGKPFDRKFSTREDLHAYAEERNMAAKNYYAQNKL